MCSIIIINILAFFYIFFRPPQFTPFLLFFVNDYRVLFLCFHSSFRLFMKFQLPATRPSIALLPPHTRAVCYLDRKHLYYDVSKENKWTKFLTKRKKNSDLPSTQKHWEKLYPIYHPNSILTCFEKKIFKKIFLRALLLLSFMYGRYGWYNTKKRRNKPVCKKKKNLVFNLHRVVFPWFKFIHTHIHQTTKPEQSYLC